jgi:hypothetical protein
MPAARGVVGALVLSGCLSTPPFPSSPTDAEAAADGRGHSADADRSSDGGPGDRGVGDADTDFSDAAPLPPRDPALSRRLLQGGGASVSPGWSIRGRLVSGGAVQASPAWRLTAKIVF